MFEKDSVCQDKSELISKRPAFKIMILLFILLNTFLLADDLYFDNNKVWKNCKVVDRSNKKINILFLQRYDHLYIEKPISSIFAVVESSINSDRISEIEHLSEVEMDMLIKTEPIKSVFHLKLDDESIPDDILYELNIMRENTSNNLISGNNLIGLGTYSRHELKKLYDYHNFLTDQEWQLQFSSKFKTPHPAAYLNFLGIASISQKDYEFGFLIMACEIGGACLALGSNNRYLQFTGLGMIQVGVIAGIVRPYIYTSKYNNALTVGLQLEHGI